MHLHFIYDLYRNMVKDGLSYVYCGYISPDLTTNILSITESNLEHQPSAAGIKKKMYFIMVESLQNITRHQNLIPPEQNTHPEFFTVRQADDDYFIISGNLIENIHIPSLDAKLKHVNTLDKDQLKAYSQSVLQEGNFSEKGGMGLGLLEMARKSGNKLAWDFVKINDIISYFYYQVKVSGSRNLGLPLKYDPSEYLESTKKLHQFVIDKKLNVIYQGEFSQENVKTIISMIEQNMSETESLTKRKKLLLIIIELLQNIYKHAEEPNTTKEEKQGIFLMGKENDKYFISASNVISNKKADELKQKLERINHMDYDALDLSINVALMREDQEKQSKKQGAGMGFMEMKMKSEHNLTFDIEPLNSEFSFFSIQVIV